MPKPRFTRTYATWDEAAAGLAALATDTARPLPELSALLDGDLHHLVLDPTTRTIWWAYDNTPLEGDGWTIEQWDPFDAAQYLSVSAIDFILDRQDDPEEYASGSADPDQDQEALDEYAGILRLTLPLKDQTAAAAIKAKRRALDRERAMLTRVHVQMARDLSTDEHGNQVWGGKAKAARTLGVTETQIGRMIREDDEARSRLTEAVKAAADRTTEQ